MKRTRNPVTRRLRVLRAQKGWTQWEAAWRLKIRPNRYNDLEHAKDKPTDSEREAFMKAFGEDVFPVIAVQEPVSL